MTKGSWRQISYCGLGLFILIILTFSLSGHAQTSTSTAVELLPEPREVSWRTPLSLLAGVKIIVDPSNADDRFTRVVLQEELKARGIDGASSKPEAKTVELLRLNNPRSARLLAADSLSFDEPMKAEGYVIAPIRKGVAVIASTAAGMFYGAETVAQLISGNGSSAVVNSAVVRDWPAMQYRGMDDDLSRGPVPTLDFQKQQIRTFARYKLNIYSPYFETTFRYKSNPLAGLPGGAMTREEYVELCRYAALYHVSVVPQQEAFGHLHNLLIYDKYAGLAETPHGSLLAPGNSEAIPLIKQWFTELAAATPGPFLHLGADETSELGKGKTHDEVQRLGLGTVYATFLSQINTALSPLHKRILFWGDVAVNEPKLVPLLPKDMIAVPWDYDLNPRGYESEILPFKQAGMETWVAPGVNNWSRVYPDNNVSLPNIQGFIRDGQHLGSTGALTTAWNDDGEGLFNQDWYGVLFAAGASWQPGENSIEKYQHSYGAVFHGDMSGRVDQAQQELMQAHKLLGSFDDRGASDVLFWVDPWSADGRATAKNIRPVAQQVRIHAERALVLLANARDDGHLRETDALAAMELGAWRMDLIGMKFELSDEMIQIYARAYAAQGEKKKNGEDIDSGLYAITDTNGRCQDLRNAYSLTRELYEQAWLRENKPFWLHNVLARYDLAIELWTQRGNTFVAAMNQWHRDHTLPAASELGMPSSFDMN